MKVLFLSHIDIFPVSSGDRLRINQQLQRLVSCHDVDTVEITHLKQALPASHFLPAINHSKLFYIPRFRRYWRAAATLFNSYPEAVNHYYHSEVADYINSIAGNYDLIFCASMVMGRYVKNLTNGRKVLDFTDSFTMNYTNAARSTSGLKSKFYSVNARRMELYESECRKVFEKILYISPDDMNYIPALREKCIVVPNSVAIPPASDCNRHDSLDPTLAFVGMMSYLPNVQAAEFLAHNVIPRLKSEFPNIRLILAGANPAPQVRSLASDSIQVTGFVDSLTPIYKDCTLFVAPMLSGSGVQNKILQAMAHGCCVVTTPLGVAGIDCPDDAIVVADTDDDFTETMASLIKEPTRCVAVGKAARSFIETNLSEHSIAKLFADLL